MSYSESEPSITARSSDFSDIGEYNIKVIVTLDDESNTSSSFSFKLRAVDEAGADF